MTIERRRLYTILKLLATHLFIIRLQTSSMWNTSEVCPKPRSKMTITVCCLGWDNTRTIPLKMPVWNFWSQIRLINHVPHYRWEILDVWNMCTELIGIYQLLPSSPMFLHLLVWKGYGIATKKVKMRLIPFLKVNLFQEPMYYYFN